jgi:transcriptional regulator with XRE-family HTH domain
MEAKMIKMLLIAMGKTQTQIAEEIGVARPYINYVINGKRKTRRVREAIAQAIHQPYEQVWPDDIKSNKDKYSPIVKVQNQSSKNKNAPASNGCDNEEGHGSKNSARVRKHALPGPI